MRSVRYAAGSTGSRVVSVGLSEASTYFCRKRQADFGADVYRKSTGVLAV
jgi:hypothetical protein